MLPSPQRSIMELFGSRRMQRSIFGPLKPRWPGFISVGGFAFLSKVAIHSLCFHLSDFVLKDIVELERTVWLV